MNSQKKKEQFINMFMTGLDDPIFEKILRVVHLGEPESELNEMIDAHNREMEMYASNFELTDATQTVIPQEEIDEKERAEFDRLQSELHSAYIVEDQTQDGINTSEPDSIEGHADVPSQLTIDNGISS